MVSQNLNISGTGKGKLSVQWEPLTLYMLNFSEGTKTYIYILYHYSTLIWLGQLESFLK